MNTIELLDYARLYLFTSMSNEEKTHVKAHVQLTLDKQLQYQLCMSFDRLTRNFGEVTRRDVAMLIETWIISQQDSYRKPATVSCG